MLRLPPVELLACPVCKTVAGEGFEPSAQRCDRCQEQFFDLAGLPCWFNTAIEQKAVWENLFHVIKARGDQNLIDENALQAQCYLRDTLARLKNKNLAERGIITAMTELFSDLNLQANAHHQYADHDPKHMLGYFELLLRDWAWDTDENQQAFHRVESVVKQSGKTLGNTWVMGCGAGRLSLDLHFSDLGATHTVAFDANLLLVGAAHRLIVQKKSWVLPEVYKYPQKDLKHVKQWHLTGDKIDATAVDGWYPMAGNVWFPPFAEAAFDTIVTPWFMDVNGKSPLALMDMLRRYLKPGGLWLNTGPLLYSDNLPDDACYSHDEIRSLMQLSGWELLNERFDDVNYLNTPLSRRKREEEVWTFAALSPTTHSTSSSKEAYPWLIVPSLPIPATTPLNHPDNPILQHLVSLVDGHTSIGDIAETMQPNLGPDKDALAVVRAAFIEYLLPSR